MKSVTIKDAAGVKLCRIWQDKKGKIWQEVLSDLQIEIIVKDDTGHKVWFSNKAKVKTE